MIDPGTGSMIFSVLIGVIAILCFVACFVIIIKLLKNRKDKKR